MPGKARKSEEATFELELDVSVGVAVGRGKMAFLTEGRARAKVGNHERMVAPSLLFSPGDFLLSFF